MPRLLLILLLAFAPLLSSCNRPSNASDQTLTLYTSVDEPVARPILQKFQQQTGIHLIIKTDTEATKTAGLAARLEAEKSNPQADVWWGNEVFHTINLARAGVLAPYNSPSARNIPPTFKDPTHLWAGAALRARVIAISTAESAPPFLQSIHSINDLANPALKGRIAIARPTAGTTGGHVAALYTLLGPEKFESLLRGLKSNDVKLLGGNSVVAESVGRGQILAGLTDNDDVESMIREGGHLRLILPDQAPDAPGTLTIPCTVALVRGAKNEPAAKKLIDYLLSPEVEQQLLSANFARYSVFPSPSTTQPTIHSMNVDYAKVAENLRPAVDLTLRILEGRD